jgi:hypothetical protein
VKHRVEEHAKPLHLLPDIHVDRFPMPDAENPYPGFNHFEHDPEITHPELPVAF